MTSRRLLLAWSLVALPYLLFSQDKFKFHQVRIVATPDGNGFKFKLASAPTLTRMNKNEPYLTYFWDFGDGFFKRGNHPEYAHSYAKGGSYQVRAYVLTGNTLDLIEQPAPISVNASASSNSETVSQPENLLITGSHYRNEMRANEDMMMAVGIKGQGGGKLFIFFNEKKHKGVKPLDFKAHSSYFGEKIGDDNLNLRDITEAKALFNDCKIFDIPKSTPSVKNLFLTFKQLADIKNKIVDNKVWTYAVYVENGRSEKANLTLDIVPAHDPNDIRVDPDFISFRGVKNQPFTYRVRFENTGKGVANSVGVKIYKPEQSDTSRIEWGDFSPKCEECPNDKPMNQIPYRCYRRTNTAEYAEIYFNNAQIAGKTKGMVDKDLNDGYIMYKLYPIQRGLKKKPLASKAVVTFDGDETPTNTARVNFTRGMWWGLKFGANYDPLSKKSNFFVGATLSPYREVRPYLQFEVMIDVNKLARQEFFTGDSTRTTVDNQICQDCFRDTLSRVTANVKQSALNFVPLQVRWDLSKSLSIGAGASADVYFRKLESTEQIVTRNVINNTCSTETLYGSPTSSVKNETTFKLAIFGDVQIGFDQFKLGARYVYPLERTKAIDYLQLFVACKF
jgi:hypothetical protein